MCKETVPELTWGSFPGLQDAPWVLPGSWEAQLGQKQCQH